VAPAVYRIPLPLPNDGLQAVNVYAIVDGDGLVMIDGGWALELSQRQLEDSLATIGYDLRDIHRFLVTHVHRDHYTQAVALRRLFGAGIALGVEERGTIDGIMAATTDAPFAEISRLRGYGASELADYLTYEHRWQPIDRTLFEAPDEWISGVTSIELDSMTLEAIPTPGHTRGHVVFRWAEAGLLFAGDHVLPHITPSIGFEVDRPPQPLADFLRSLRLIADLPDARLLPAHGPPTESVHERLEELEQHHERRLELSEQALESGAETALDAARLLTWTRRELAYYDLDPFNQMLAIAETAAHLDLLVLRRRATSSPDGEVVRYALPPRPVLLDGAGVAHTSLRKGTDGLRAQ
jgi:glyoxylase-like metal-dependent hydrolase (beta-lactamase superfamily II)